jgi:hypothetical protein
MITPQTDAGTAALSLRLIETCSKITRHPHPAEALGASTVGKAHGCFNHNCDWTGCLAAGAVGSSACGGTTQQAHPRLTARHAVAQVTINAKRLLKLFDEHSFLAYQQDASHPQHITLCCVHAHAAAALSRCWTHQL